MGEAEVASMHNMVSTHQSICGAVLFGMQHANCCLNCRSHDRFLMHVRPCVCCVAQAMSVAMLGLQISTAALLRLHNWVATDADAKST